MQQPQQAPRKRPPQALDQLPYQRTAVLRRRLHVGAEDRVQELLGRHSGGAVRVVFGRVIGHSTQRDISLPVSTEVLLEDGAHDFSPVLSAEMHHALAEQMEARLGAWTAGGPTSVRWDSVFVKEGPAHAPAEPAERMTVYCPGSAWHFQLEVGTSVAQPLAQQGAPSGRQVIERTASACSQGTCFGTRERWLAL